MIVGYARTSTIDQAAGLEAQIRDLTAAGCERIFHEQLSGVDRERPEFKAAMAFVRDGDKLVVTKLERLARSTRHLLEIEADLTGRGVALQILNLNIDTATPTGKLLFTVVAAIGQFERELMLERQREGIAAARRAGKYKGGHHKALPRIEEIRRLIDGGLSLGQTAKALGLGKTTVHDALKRAAAEMQ